MLENIPSPQQLFDVTGKVAIVTGATGGFGQAAGLISLGQAAFIGIGAYTAAIAMNQLDWPFAPAVIAGALLAGLFALLIAFPIFRFQGVYFTIGTLILAEALRLWMINWEWTGGAQGMRFPIGVGPELTGLYYLMLGVAAEIAHHPSVIKTYLGKPGVAGDWPPAASNQPPATNSQPPLLQVRNLSAGYGSFQALFDVSLAVHPGEIVALIGLNGAGKSTLIRAITRQLPLLTGEVRWHDVSINQRSVNEIAELGIAQAIEGRKIFPLMTVHENLEMGAYPARARAKRSQTMARAFAIFPRLQERVDQLGGTLSGGEQQMLAIGRALMALPDLLILDEVSLGLAPLVINDLYRVIGAINASGVTILLVEQSVQRSLEVAQRAYIIEHGRIILSGTAEELRNDPAVQKAYFGL